jgi:hypothetical protein
MFGTENAGARETSMRFRMARREDKPTERKVQQAVSISGKGLGLNDRGEMYFAVRASVRWTL